MASHKGDILAGLAVLAVCAMFHFQSADLEGLALLFPRMLVIFMTIGGLYLVAKGVVKGRRFAHVEHKEAEPLDAKRVVTIALGSIVYVLTIPVVGFYLTTVLFLFAMSFILSDGNKKSLKKVVASALFTAVLCISVWLGFSLLLSVPTPTGMLF